MSSSRIGAIVTGCAVVGRRPARQRAEDGCPQVVDAVAGVGRDEQRARSPVARQGARGRPQATLLGRRQLVDLGEHQLNRHPQRGQPFQQLRLLGGNPAPGVHQHDEQRQRRAAFHVAFDQGLPGRALGLRNLRVAKPGQIRQPQLARSARAGGRRADP